MNIERIRRARRDRSTTASALEDRLYSNAEVEGLLKEQSAELQAQYALLKEVYAEYLAVKEENGELKERLLTYEQPDDGYRREWTWIRKIVFALESAGRPMRSSEIIEVLERREPHLRNHTSKQQYFSAFLHMALKRGRITREKRAGERGYYYRIRQTDDHTAL